MVTTQQNRRDSRKASGISAPVFHWATCVLGDDLNGKLELYQACCPAKVAHAGDESRKECIGEVGTKEMESVKILWTSQISFLSLPPAACRPHSAIDSILVQHVLFSSRPRSNVSDGLTAARSVPSGRAYLPLLQRNTWVADPKPNVVGISSYLLYYLTAGFCIWPLITMHRRDAREWPAALYPRHL